MSFPPTTTGDLAQATLLRLSQFRVKSDLARLSQEMTTGQRSELHPKLGGDLAPLATLQRSRAAITPWQGAANEAEIAFDAAQDAVSHIGTTVRDMALTAIEVAGQGSDTDVARFAETARRDFKSLVADLNTSTAGQSLFAGTATDGAATIHGDDILDELSTQAILAGATTSADYLSIVDAYFAPGGDFETTAYQGATQVSTIKVSPDVGIEGLPTATDPVVQETLHAAAIVALAGDQTVGLSAVDQHALVDAASKRLLSAEAALTGLRADLGSRQERIEVEQTRLSTEAAALDKALSDLTTADPYETATHLEATRIQLDTLYAVTARLSSLGLAGYLR